MEAYQEKVILERLDLISKLLSLRNFIDNENTPFKHLDYQEQTRLTCQRYIMELYVDVLNKRIVNFR